MELSLGYGSSAQFVDIPDHNMRAVLEANEIDFELRDEDEVRRSMQQPIGSKRLSEIVHSDEKIVIITSDITRPMPTEIVLPIVLEELSLAGIKPCDVVVVFALGSHRKHTEEEKRKLVGSALNSGILLVDSSEGPFVNRGITKRGTPIELMELVADADRRICLGNIEYHYFAGYSGGCKALFPGVSTMAAIEANHALMVDARACTGGLEGNPVREDLEEAALAVGIDFIVNVVLDENRRIVKSFAGDWIAAHRAGCKYLDSLYRVKIKQRADIVVASQGGLPKDLNLYQLQKALDNASRAVRDGGIIVLVGCCKEGLGNRIFEEWMLSADTPSDLICRAQRGFQLGGHKAAAIAKVLSKAEVYLVSELDDELARKCFFEPFDTVQDAVDAALAKKGFSASVLVMPHAGSTVPYCG